MRQRGGCEVTACKCGSYALNIAPQSGRCDVCYYRDEAERLAEAIRKFLRWENAADRTKASPEEWMEQTERLAAALKGGAK